MDADAAAYIAAVESADMATLPNYIKNAVDSFVIGCKTDNNWTSLKSSCLFVGPATLNGALVPLTGTGPTNNNFSNGDHDQQTGLKGNGSTAYLNSNRKENDDPQNSKHLSVYVTEAMTTLTGGLIGGLNTSPLVGSQIYSDSSTGFFRCNSSSTYSLASYRTQTGFIGISRSSSSQFSYRLAGSTSTVSNTSAAGYSVDIHVFRRNWTTTNHTDARLAFYSIGESVDLALLDSRLSTYIAAIAAGPVSITSTRRRRYAGGYGL